MFLDKRVYDYFKVRGGNSENTLRDNSITTGEEGVDSRIIETPGVIEKGWSTALETESFSLGTKNSNALLG